MVPVPSKTRPTSSAVGPSPETEIAGFQTSPEWVPFRAVVRRAAHYAGMSRFTYELARDHRADADSTADYDWHIVRLDDEDDPAHLHALCERDLELPVEHWSVESLKDLQTLVCHQCQIRHLAETGREAA